MIIIINNKVIKLPQAYLRSTEVKHKFWSRNSTYSSNDSPVPQVFPSVWAVSTGRHLNGQLLQHCWIQTRVFPPLSHPRQIGTLQHFQVCWFFICILALPIRSSLNSSARTIQTYKCATSTDQPSVQAKTISKGWRAGEVNKLAYDSLWQFCMQGSNSVSRYKEA